MVLGTDGFGILVGRPCKGLEIISQRIHLDHLIHKSLLGAIGRSGIVMVFLGQGVHFFNDGFQRTAGILFLDEPPGKAGSGDMGEGKK